MISQCDPLLITLIITSLFPQISIFAYDQYSHQQNNQGTVLHININTVAHSFHIPRHHHYSDSPIAGSASTPP